MKRKAFAGVCAIVLSLTMTVGAGSSLAYAADTEISVEDTENENIDDGVSVEDSGITADTENEQESVSAAGTTDDFADDLATVEDNTFSAGDEESTTSYTDYTSDTSVIGITSLKGQLFYSNNQAKGTSDYVSADMDTTPQVVTRRTMDNKTQTWRVINVYFEPDALKMSGNTDVGGRMKITTEDSENPIQSQMTVGNCYYLNDGDTIRNSVYKEQYQAWQPLYGKKNLMYGETTAKFNIEYYCIYKNNGKIIRYLINMVRKGCAGIEHQPTYNETNPAPLNWVYDEDTGTYAADMKELDSAVDANKVQKYNEEGMKNDLLQWESIVSNDSNSNLYVDEDKILHVKKAGQYDVYKASWAGKDYYLPIRFTYDKDERAPRALNELKTDGITDMSEYGTAESFAAQFSADYSQKAKEYYTLVMTLQKTLDNTEYGTTRGDWDYSIRKNRPWDENCESAQVDKAREMAVEIWENIFELKETKQKICDYIEGKAASDEEKEKLENVKQTYIAKLQKRYESGKIQEKADVEDILVEAQKEADSIVPPTKPSEPSEPVKPSEPTTPSEPAQPQTPSTTEAETYKILNAAKKTITKIEGCRAFNLGVKTKTKASLSYKTSDKKVAVVDRKGKITVKGPGRATITVTGKANGMQTETAKITVTVKPSAKLSPKVTAQGGKKLNVTWKRNKRATGYQIVVATDKSFRHVVRTVNIKKNNIVKATVKGLKSGQKYYVRVRSFKKSSGGNVYGNWAKTKAVKVRE